MESSVVIPPWRANLAVVGALMARARNELLRVPGAVIPGVLAPTIFFLGINGVFGGLTDLSGFPTESYPSFLVPISMLQAAGFAGAAAGVNLARDVEQGRLDRLLAASARSLIPATFVLCVAFAVGAHFPGVDGLAIAYAMVAGMAVVAACWASMLALRFKTQSASPLMQAGMLALIFLTPAYAPMALLEGWLKAIAQVNPVTHVLEAARQGFLGGLSWGDTWPGIVAVAGMATLLGALALREMRRTAV
jgi:ABC-2 type transport system permease protein